MFNSQWEITKGRERFKKKESKTIIFTKKNILMLLKGGGGGMGLREVLGLTEKYVFGK